MKSHLKFLIYHIGYMTVKDHSYTAANSVNPLNLIIYKINDYIEVSNGIKHLTLVSEQNHTKKYKELYN